MALPASENVTLPRHRHPHQRFWRLFHNIPLLGLPLRSLPVHNVSLPSQVTALLEGLKLEPTIRFRFLDLPPEIRNIIYQIHLETRDPYRVFTGNTERPQAGVNLLRCCKQIDREATQYMNHKRRWMIGDPKLTEFELLWLSLHGPTNDQVLFRDRKYFAHGEKHSREYCQSLNHYPRTILSRMLEPWTTEAELPRHDEEAQASANMLSPWWVFWTRVQGIEASLQSMELDRQLNIQV